MACIGAGLVGCGGAANLPPKQHTATPHQTPIVWDCGIVLPGQRTSVTFPLDITGATSSADIVRIETSCECVAVSLVDLVDGEYRSHELAAQIVIDRSEERRAERNHALMVNVTFHTHQGNAQVASVKTVLL